MKKILLLMLVVVTSLAAQARDEIIHDAKALPTAAYTTIKNNFKSDISFIKVDRSLGRITEYEVVLTDGSEIKFDAAGNWKEIECSRASSVPASFVPKAIINYVNKFHRGNKIVGIDKERNGYEVMLSNDIEIKFDKNGNFKKYDK